MLLDKLSTISIWTYTIYLLIARYFQILQYILASIEPLGNLRKIELLHFLDEFSAQCASEKKAMTNEAHISFVVLYKMKLT